MEHLRTEIWDQLYRSGPQSIEQIASKLRLNAVTVSAVIDHQWFERRGAMVIIAIERPAGVDHKPSG